MNSCQRDFGPCVIWRVYYHAASGCASVHCWSSSVYSALEAFRSSPLSRYEEALNSRNECHSISWVKVVLKGKDVLVLSMNKIPKFTIWKIFFNIKEIVPTHPFLKSQASCDLFSLRIWNNKIVSTYTDAFEVNYYYTLPHSYTEVWVWGYLTLKEVGCISWMFYMRQKSILELKGASTRAVHWENGSVFFSQSCKLSATAYRVLAQQRLQVCKQLVGVQQILCRFGFAAVTCLPASRLCCLSVWFAPVVLVALQRLSCQDLLH